MLNSIPALLEVRKMSKSFSFILFGNSEIGEYTNPTGGYFVTFYSNKPIAKKIVTLCSEAGLMLTPAGSTYPYGNDPNDSVLRIAPTYIDIDELDVAMDIFVLSAEIAHSEI